MRHLSRLICALLLLSSVCFGQTQTRIGKNDFLFGINQPWFGGSYGHDLGREAQHPKYGIWYNVNGNSDKVSACFRDVSNSGFRIVRFWVMERSEGWEVDSNGFITGLNDEFLRNLDDVVKKAKENNLKLYLCLTTGCLEIDFPSHIKDPRQQKAYIDNCVRPLTKRFKGNSTIFAFDIINEIESEFGDNVGPDKIDIAQARVFLRNNVKAIKEEDPKRLVSSGSAIDMVQKFQGLGFDFYDVHSYRDDGWLPPARDFKADRPIIIGECGQGTRKDDEDLQRKAVTAFMNNAVNNGYAGCFPWSYGPNERYFRLVLDDGAHRPAMDDIEKIIKMNKKGSAQKPKKKLVSK